MTNRPAALFAVVSVLWGTPYLFIKVAVDDGVPPLFVAWARLVLAAALLLALAPRTGQFRVVRGRWRWLAAYSVFELAVPFPLLAIGEQYVSSALTAEIVASVPLLIALLALRFEAAERVDGRRLAGLLIGFAGVVALLGIDLTGTEKGLLGAALILLAALGYAVGPLIFNRHFADLDPRATVGASSGLAAVVLTPLALLDPPAAIPSAGTAGSLVALGLLSTGAALLFFAQLTVRVGPGRAVLTTYVAPVVAVAAGMLVLDERPGPGAVVGLVLILSGSWLATQTGRGGPRPVAAAYSENAA